MVQSEKLKDLLREFGSMVGIGNLTPDQDNYCCLSVDEKIMLHVKLDEPSEQLMFLTQIGKFDDANKNALYELLLKENFKYAQSDMIFTLAKSVGENAVALSYKEYIGAVEFPRFEAIMKAMLETAEQWGEKVQACVQGLLTSGSEPTITPPTEENPGMLGMRV